MIDRYNRRWTVRQQAKVKGIEERRRIDRVYSGQLQTNSHSKSEGKHVERNASNDF